MSSTWVPTVGTVIVALLGFAGVLVAQLIANRRADKQEDRRWERDKESRAETRSHKRRRELAQAIAEFASTVASLRRAEYRRNIERIGHLSEAERQPAKLDTYSLRADAESKMYLISLLSDQEKDRDLAKDARTVIELCYAIDKSASESDLRDRNENAKVALRRFIDEAGRRIQGDANSAAGHGVAEA